MERDQREAGLAGRNETRPVGFPVEILEFQAFLQNTVRREPVPGLDCQGPVASATRLIWLPTNEVLQPGLAKVDPFVSQLPAPPVFRSRPVS